MDVMLRDILDAVYKRFEAMVKENPDAWMDNREWLSIYLQCKTLDLLDNIESELIDMNPVYKQ